MIESSQEMPVSSIHQTVDSVSEGDRVYINKKKRPLIVGNHHTRFIQEVYRRQAGDQGHKDILELSNGKSVFHLVWHHGSDSAPVLYSEGDWDRVTLANGTTRFKYPGSGREVTQVEKTQIEATVSSNVGPIIIGSSRVRDHLCNEGEVLTFRAHRRTTGKSWWRESRDGEKMGDVEIETIDRVEAEPQALEPYREKSAFQTVTDWLATIDELDQQPAGSCRGYLYRIRATEGDCGNCGETAPLPTNRFCPACEPGATY